MGQCLDKLEQAILGPQRQTHLNTSLLQEQHGHQYEMNKYPIITPPPPATVVQAPRQNTYTTAATPFCMNCGQMCKPEDSFCIMCGTPRGASNATSLDVSAHSAASSNGYTGGQSASFQSSANSSGRSMPDMDASGKGAAPLNQDILASIRPPPMVDNSRNSFGENSLYTSVPANIFREKEKQKQQQNLQELSAAGGTQYSKIRQPGEGTQQQSDTQASDSDSSTQDRKLSVDGQNSKRLLYESQSDAVMVDASMLTLGKQLAEGSTAIVYSGTYQGAPAAIKRVRHDKLAGQDERDDEDVVRQLKDEAHLMTTLRHPNIIQFYALSMVQGDICLIMEMMSRGSLRDLLNDQSQQLPLRLRVKLLKESCLGLRYLHSRRPVVIHRDLKSMNILLDDHLTCKLTDFGISRLKEGKSQAITSFSGTVSWMAPELLAAQPTYTEAVDVYAMAMVIFEVLTREVPWKGYHVGQVVAAVAHEKDRPRLWQPQSAPEAELQKLMEQMWDHHPRKRPDMKQVTQQIEQIWRSLQ